MACLSTADKLVRRELATCSEIARECGDFDGDSVEADLEESICSVVSIHELKYLIIDQK